MFRKFQCQKLQFQSLERPNFSIPATFRIPIFRNAKIYNSSVWKSQNLQFQCLKSQNSEFRCFAKSKLQNSNDSKKPKFRILMFGKRTKIQKLNIWKGQCLEFQCLENQKLEFQCFEKPKFTIPMFGKSAIYNSNVWKSQNSEFQCFAKIQNSNAWKKPKFRIPVFGKRQNSEF